MTSIPKRLVEDLSCDPALRDLLEEAALEPGSATAKKNTLAALGLAGVATAAVTAGGLANGAIGGSSTAVGALGTTAVGTASAGAVIKIVVASIVALGVVGSGITVLVRDRTEAPVVATTATAAATPLAIAPPVSASALAEPAPVNALPAADPAPVKTTPARPTASATSRLQPTSEAAEKPVSRLAEEAAALELARRELGAGRPSAALNALDGYDRRFTQGELRPEAVALRVEALAASGDHAAARALGEAFLARHAQHPAVRRVRRALGHTIP